MSEAKLQGEEAQASVPTQDVTSVFANRVHVTAGYDVVRVVFGDTFDGSYTNWHSGVVMRTADAKDLKNMLTNLLDQIDALTTKVMPGKDTPDGEAQVAYDARGSKSRGADLGEEAAARAMLRGLERAEQRER